MQVASRNVVVWLVVGAFPEIIQGRDILPGFKVMQGNGWGEWGFVGCLLAWGVVEMIKYGYFVFQLGLGGAPGWLLWLR